MSILGVLGRFTLIYIVLNIIVGLTLYYLDIGSNIGVTMGILLGAIFWVCSSFAKKNGRYFDKGEKTKVVAGFIIISIVIQAILGAAAVVESGIGPSGSILLFSIGFVGILHAVAIYFFVGNVKKSLLKQGIINS